MASTTTSWIQKQQQQHYLQQERGEDSIATQIYINHQLKNVEKAKEEEDSDLFLDPEQYPQQQPPQPDLSENSQLLLHEFYSNGRSVFITGGTGFVGKVLVEKLLYQFPNIGTVYLLLRPKAGQLIRKRVSELIESPVFDRVRQHCPRQLSKIYPISGDISYPGLGINPLDLQQLIDNVSVIFHSAATIRFDEPLK